MIQVKVFNSFPVGADWDELFVASVEAGELTMVDFFLKNGAEIDTSAGLALNYASLHGDLKLVKYLVEKGANINIEPFVATPLSEAVQGGHLEVVKYLVEKGANVNANNKQALKYAIALNNLEIVKYLAEHGADFYSNNNWGLRFSEEINSRKAIIDYLRSSAKRK